MCDNLHPSSQVHATSRFMEVPNDLLCADAFKYPVDDTSKMPCLIGNPPKSLLISNMDTMIKNQGTLEEELIDALYMELDERNIGLRYNTTMLTGYIK